MPHRLRKREMQHLDFLRAELNAHGIEVHSLGRNQKGHVEVYFYRGSNLQRVTFGASDDWKARLRNRSFLRGVIGGVRDATVKRHG